MFRQSRRQLKSDILREGFGGDWGQSPESLDAQLSRRGPMDPLSPPRTEAHPGALSQHDRAVPQLSASPSHPEMAAVMSELCLPSCLPRAGPGPQ